MNQLAQDLRYALRQLRKSPGFTAVAILTLALGIGANTAIFNLIKEIMLQHFEVSKSQQLVLLKWRAKEIPNAAASASYSNCPEGGGPEAGALTIFSSAPLDSQGCSFSRPFFDQVHREKKIFSDVAAFAPVQQLSVNFDGQTLETGTLFVSGDFFSTMRMHAFLGRMLSPVDDTEIAAPAIVVSYRFWSNHLGADRSIVGKHIRVEKATFTVTGVASPNFPDLDPGVPCDLWLPLAFRPSVPFSPPSQAANVLWLEIVARLQPETRPTQAASAMSTLFAGSTSIGPGAIFKPSAAPQIELSSVTHGLATLRRNFSRPLFAALAAVAIVLLVCCANLAGLMLARSAARRRELALRFALGATRARVIRQVLAESLLLSLIGGAGGILTAELGDKVLVGFLSRNWFLPLSLKVHTDARVLLFTLLISVLVGLAFGLVPALCSRSAGLIPALKKGDSARPLAANGRLSLASSLVAIQVVLTMLVLTAAGLLLRTLMNLEGEHLGFDPHNLIVFRVDATYSPRAAKNPEGLYRELQQRLSSLPGVLSATSSGVLLISGGGIGGPIFLGSASQGQDRAHFLPVSNDFLRTMQIPLLQGRALNDQDLEAAGHPGTPTRVVVNEALVQRFFAGKNPIGKYFHIGSAAGPEEEIVGVVSDGKYDNVRDDVWPTVYTPISGWNGDRFFEVRSALQPQALIPEIEDALRRFDNSLLVVGMKTQAEQIDQNIYQERLMARLSSLFAGLALLIACIGIYGLLSFQVARRTPEIGIRLALGAQRRDVLRVVVVRGVTLALVGTLVGAALSVVLSRYLQRLLFDVRPFDPLSLIAVMILLIAVAMFAAYVPARRAAKVDPMVALRYE